MRALLATEAAVFAEQQEAYPAQRFDLAVVPGIRVLIGLAKVIVQFLRRGSEDFTRAGVR